MLTERIARRIFRPVIKPIKDQDEGWSTPSESVEYSHNGETWHLVNGLQPSDDQITAIYKTEFEALPLAATTISVAIVSCGVVTMAVIIDGKQYSLTTLSFPENQHELQVFEITLGKELLSGSSQSLNLILTWECNNKPPIIIKDKTNDIVIVYENVVHAILSYVAIVIPIWVTIFFVLVSLSYVVMRFARPGVRYEFFAYSLFLFSIFAGFTSVKRLPIRRFVFKMTSRIVAGPAIGRSSIYGLLLLSVIFPAVLAYCFMSEQQFRALAMKNSSYANIISLFKLYPERIESQYIAAKEIQSWQTRFDRNILETTVGNLVKDLAFLRSYAGGTFGSNLCLCNDRETKRNPKFWYATIVQLSRPVGNLGMAKRSLEIASEVEEQEIGAKFYRLNTKLEWWFGSAYKILEDAKINSYVPRAKAVQVLKMTNAKNARLFEQYLVNRDAVVAELEKNVSKVEMSPDIRKSHYYQEANDHLAQHYLTICKEREANVPPGVFLKKADKYFREAIEARNAEIHRSKDLLIWLRSPGKLGIYHLFLDLENKAFQDRGTKNWLASLRHPRCKGADEMIQSIYDYYAEFQDPKIGDYKKWRQGSIRGEVARDRKKVLTVSLNNGWRF